MAFTVLRRTPLASDLAWAALTDLAEHANDVPFTDVVVPEGGLVLGAEVVAWTRLGRLGFADRMLVTAVDPGRRLRLVKVGRLLHGWAQITVLPDPASPGASSVEWVEEVWLPGLRRITRPVGDRLGPVLFGRVVDGVLTRATARVVEGPVSDGGRAA
jgi:hypothetical protein